MTIKRIAACIFARARLAERHGGGREALHAVSALALRVRGRQKRIRARGSGLRSLQ